MGTRSLELSLWDKRLLHSREEPGERRDGSLRLRGLVWFGVRSGRSRLLWEGERAGRCWPVRAEQVCGEGELELLEHGLVGLVPLALFVHVYMLVGTGDHSFVLEAFARDLAVSVDLELLLEHEAALLVGDLADLAQQHLDAVLSHAVAAVDEVGADVLELGGAVLLYVQVLDELGLDAPLVAVRGLHAAGGALLVGLLVAQLQHADLHVVVGVDLVLALLDGLQVASRPRRQLHRGLHLELLALAQHEPPLLLLLAHAVGEHQVLGGVDCVDLHHERLSRSARARREAEVAELGGLAPVGVVLEDQLAGVVREVAGQLRLLDRAEQLLLRVLLQIHQLYHRTRKRTRHIPKVENGQRNDWDGNEHERWDAFVDEYWQRRWVGSQKEIDE